METSALEITKNYIRIPVAFFKKNHTIRTIELTEDIKALYDVESKKIVTFLFNRNKYDLQSAKNWLQKHNIKGLNVSKLNDKLIHALENIVNKKSE